MLIDTNIGEAMLLGHSMEVEGAPVFFFPRDQVLSMQVVGPPGSGKSKLLQNMIEYDTENGRGLCLIDPHGNLVQDVLRYLYLYPEAYRGRKVVVLDPTDQQWSFGFNPFAKRIDNPDDRAAYVGSLVESIIKIWSGTESFANPLIKNTLETMFYVLMSHNLPLNTALDFLRFDDPSGVREQLTVRQEIDNPMVRSYWEEVSALNRRDFRDVMNGADRRVQGLLFSGYLSRIFSSDTHIDLLGLMDEGAIILVDLNTAGRMSRDQSAIFASMFITEIYNESLKRDPESANPFTVYIDECHRYLRGDVTHILEELRKFGVGLVLGHQHLGQLKRHGPDLYEGIMTMTQNKVVFKPGSYDDAAYWAKDLFMYETDKVKQTTMEVVGQRIRTLKGKSTSEGETDTKGTSEADSETTTEGQTITNTQQETTTEGQALNVTGSEQHTTSKGVAVGESHTTSESHGTSWGNVQSFSEGRSHSEGEVMDWHILLGLPHTLNESWGRNSQQGSSTSQGGSHSTSEAHTQSVVHSETESHGVGFSKGFTSSLSKAQSMARSIAHSISRAIGKTITQSMSKAISSSRTRTVRQVLEPIYREVPKVYESIDNQRHARAQELLNLPQAHACVRIQGSAPILLSCVWMDDLYVNPDSFNQFVYGLKEECDDLYLLEEREQTAFYVEAEEAELDVLPAPQGEMIQFEQPEYDVIVGEKRDD